MRQKREGIMDAQEKGNDLLKGVNRFVLCLITFMDVIIAAGYPSDYRRGNISLGFMLMIESVVVLSLVINYATYFNKRGAHIFKYVSIVSYMLLYGMAVFGAQNDLVFVMMFPMTVIYILYFDYKLVLGLAVVFGMINVADVAYVAVIMRHAHSGVPVNSTSLLIQAACTVVYLFVLCGTTKISNKNNEAKISGLNQEKAKGDALLEDVLGLVAVVKKNSVDAAEYIQGLRKDVDVTAAALSEISDGNSTNTANIEKQTTMTGNIQEMILDTKRMSDDMLELAQRTNEAVTGGQTSVSSLQEQSEKTRLENQKVVETMTNLLTNVESVQSITTRIFSISSQEVFANTQQAVEMGESSREQAKSAEQLMQELLDNVGAVNKYL
ncbi:MAG: methyl-accepting chemotaxis protein [Muribaculaceae bacterium]|nr:methyl-accepting chemotaxis protein [Roseburia sp.]MCM1432261.1 methyl-accepting chemotaxis protein [Muribaculaceae bacterium]MCM1494000.1 methyl-accepting chemotaxis protein [Muribaculaceae bacterium]MCM1561061.1 methyl-accepting chemotaxis protein [Butyrivibrio sp.]